MKRRLIALAIVLLAAAAVHAESLRLLAPSDGATLRGGRFATLSWTRGRPGPNAEEWEAFLSVDGGRFYAVRLTPHLDIAVHTFEVLIPNVDSSDVRILIRTGDERNETIIPMPQRFRIRAEAAPLQPAATRDPGPESARPNEPRVVQWSVGGHVETTANPPSMLATAAPPAPVNEIASATRPLVRSGGQTIMSVRTGRIARPPLRARNSEILQRSSRMNV